MGQRSTGAAVSDDQKSWEVIGRVWDSIADEGLASAVSIRLPGEDLRRDLIVLSIIICDSQIVAKVLLTPASV